MSLKSSRVMPLSLSSGCTTSTSSWSNSCFLENKIPTIQKQTTIYTKTNMKNKVNKKWKTGCVENVLVRGCPEICSHFSYQRPGRLWECSYGTIKSCLDRSRFSFSWYRVEGKILALRQGEVGFLEVKEDSVTVSAHFLVPDQHKSGRLRAQKNFAFRQPKLWNLVIIFAVLLFIIPHLTYYTFFFFFLMIKLSCLDSTY